MSGEVLTSKNFIFFCIKNYKNTQCTGIDEFNEDIKRLKYIKKLLTRYEQTGELKERLILNHLIILSNVFEPEFLARILTLKMRDYLKFLKPFLVLLSILPEEIKNVEVKGAVIVTDEIEMDNYIVQKLREL